jgi:GlpG protein
VWVHWDDHLDQAQELLKAYVESPDAPEFERVAAEARAKIKLGESQHARARKNYIDMRQQWRRESFMAGKVGTVTLVLIIISVGVAVVSRLGANNDALQPLFITEYRIEQQGEQVRVSWLGGMPEVRRGQLWRLFTPMFIHFGLLHILFNMLWLKDLGSMIERRQSSWMLIGVVLATSVAGNLAQYAWSGPSFGGMSGVVYGLLGYVWLRGRYDPQSGLSLDKRIVVWMGIWFLICLTPMMPNVANAAHGAGLAVGAAWGFISSGRLLRGPRVG